MKDLSLHDETATLDIDATADSMGLLELTLNEYQDTNMIYLTYSQQVELRDHLDAALDEYDARPRGGYHATGVKG